MRADWTQRHRELLLAVAAERIELDMTRGAWVGPDYKKRMGCYAWDTGDRLPLRDIEALIELREAAFIVTVPGVGTDYWPVRLTPSGQDWAGRLIARRAVKS